MKTIGIPKKQGLYDPQFEHDACGVGFVVNMKGEKSHEIVRQALTILVNLDHRGACGCEANTGDGAGILMQMPHGFLRKVCAPLGIELPEPAQYGVGMVFTRRIRPSATAPAICWKRSWPRKARRSSAGATCRPTIPRSAKPPGPASRSCARCSSGAGADCADELAFERKLYIISKRAINEIRRAGVDDVLVRLQPFLPDHDLQGHAHAGAGGPILPRPARSGHGDRAGAGAFALFHQHLSELGPRPSLSLHRAQRRDQHPARQHQLDARPPGALCQPTCSATTSRRSCRSSTPTAATRRCSTTAWNCLVMAGRSLPHAVMMMIPEPWENHESMSPARRPSTNTIPA